MFSMFGIKKEILALCNFHSMGVGAWWGVVNTKKKAFSLIE